MKLLLQYKADINAADDWQRTPLAEARAQPPDDTIKKLLETHAAVGSVPDVPEPSRVLLELSCQ